MSFSSGLQLRVIKGQSEKGRVVQLDGKEFTLGRGQQGQRPGQGELLFLESSVSRLHASLSWKEGKGFQLTHRSSTNPTMVNGKSTKKVMLEPGDKIQMGLLILGVEEVRQDSSINNGGSDGRSVPMNKVVHRNEEARHSANERKQLQQESTTSSEPVASSARSRLDEALCAFRYFT